MQARRIQRKAAEQGVGEAPVPEHPERQSLGVLGGLRPGAAAGGASRAGGLLGGAAGFKRKVAANPENGNAGGGGGGLDIFVDDEFAGGPSASAPAAFLQPGRCGRQPAWDAVEGRGACCCWCYVWMPVLKVPSTCAPHSILDPAGQPRPPVRGPS